MGTAVGQRPEATRLGSYEILRRLARGGMAELFLARTVGPEGFEKLVVLKKILPRFADSPKFVRLFLDEARIAAMLDHPHIAHVYDIGKVESSYFFTMEYVHGQDLHATVKRTARLGLRVPIDLAVQIGHAVASALHYAHDRRAPDGEVMGIVHRDVSPSNILIAYDGVIKLVDFGVAKAATSSVKTRTGTLKGKISYMSPEQAKGSPIDRRSDVFSLGTVLWELVTSQRLFKAENDLATIQRIIHSAAEPPARLRPDCPRELEAIILKALAANVDRRYQSAEALQLDLEEFAREHKLKQSTVALREHMHDLFADEIAAWAAAQASGVTLTDHVVAASIVETPESYGELSFVDDDELEELDELDAPTEPPRQPVQGGFDAQPRAPTSTPPHASIVVAGVPMPIAQVPSGPHRPATGPAPHVAAAQRSGTLPPYGEPSAFPIAPREWRSTGPAAQVGPQHARNAKRYAIAVLVGIAVLALLALALGGGRDRAAARAPGAAPPSDDPVIEMKTEPATTTPPR